MTRGLLSQIPVLFGAERALITETECSARGGRRCLYAVTWEVTESELAEDRPGVPETAGHPVEPVGATSGAVPEPPETAPERLGGSPGGNDAGQSKAELREQLDRMSVLVEGAFATSLELLDDDAESLLTQIAARADAVVVGPPLPLDGPSQAGDTHPAPSPGPRGQGGPAVGRRPLARPSR